MYVATYVQSTKVTSVAIITVANEFYPHSYVHNYTYCYSKRYYRHT